MKLYQKLSEIGHDQNQKNDFEKEIVELTNKQIKTLFEVARLGKKDIFYDLGSGTGQIVINAIIKTNVKKAIGIELNKKYYDIAKKKAFDILSKRHLRNKIDFWYGDYSDYKKDHGYVYDISDGTVIYNSLAPDGNIVFYDTQFLRKQNIKIIKKDLPLVGYEPVAVSRKEKNAWFFLMKTPLSNYRISSKKKWAQLVLGDADAEISDVYRYFRSLWETTNERKKPYKVLKELKKLVGIYLPDE